MGLGGINAWQLFLILLIFVLALAAAPIRHHGDTEPPAGDGADEPDEHEDVENRGGGPGDS